MSKISNDLLTRIKSLPPLPESVIEIQRICSDPDAGIGDLAKVVNKDPMLTANLLKAANSPLYGFSKEITNINQAVSLFGMATVKGFALASAVKNGIKIDMSPYGIDTNRFSDIAQLQSALMLNWYSKVDRTKMEILAPASFLDGVGAIIIAAEIIHQKKTQEFKKEIEEAQNIEDVEIKYFNVSSQEIAAEIFTKWRLDPIMIKTIAASNSPQDADDDIKDYAYALKIVRNTVSIKESFGEESIKKSLELIKEAGLKEEPFLQTLKILNPS